VFNSLFVRLLTPGLLNDTLDRLHDRVISRVDVTKDRTCDINVKEGHRIL
jgi:hypothetical protein